MGIMSGQRISIVANIAIDIVNWASDLNMDCVPIAGKETLIICMNILS